MNTELKGKDVIGANCFLEETIAEWDIITETIMDAPGSTEKVRSRAKELRKAGYNVATRKSSFYDLARCSATFIGAVKRKRK